MKIVSCEIPDVKIIEPKIFGDNRGYFFESYRHEVFEKEIGTVCFVQENESGIRYDDPFLKIDWLLDKSQIKLSVKDKNHSCFEKLLAAKYFQYKLK